jgi:hypothetical protein
MKRKTLEKIEVIFLGLSLVGIIMETYIKREIEHDLTEKMDFDAGMIFPNAIDRLSWLIGGLVGDTQSIGEVYEVIDYIEEGIHSLTPPLWYQICKILLVLSFGGSCYSLGRRRE